MVLVCGVVGARLGWARPVAVAQLQPRQVHARRQHRGVAYIRLRRANAQPDRLQHSAAGNSCPLRTATTFAGMNPHQMSLMLP